MVDVLGGDERCDRRGSALQAKGPCSGQGPAGRRALRGPNETLRDTGSVQVWRR